MTVPLSNFSVGILEFHVSALKEKRKKRKEEQRKRTENKENTEGTKERHRGHRAKRQQWRFLSGYLYDAALGRERPNGRWLRIPCGEATGG